MRFSFNAWRASIDEIHAEEFPVETPVSSGFPIHPSASELAEEMLVDPEVLKNETYEPGIYDEDGDYYPQYSDDPASMPEYIAPNDLTPGDTAPESKPGDTAPESKPGDTTTSSSDSSDSDNKE